MTSYRQNIPTSYSEAKAALGTSVVKPMGYATTLGYSYRNSRPALYHFRTAIVEYNQDGTLTLDTQGWHSATTKARLNLALGNRGRVWQDKGEWYYYSRKTWNTNTSPPATRVPFEDGMVIGPDGDPVGATP